MKQRDKILALSDIRPILSVIRPILTLSVIRPRVGLIMERGPYNEFIRPGPYIMQNFRILQTSMGLISDIRPRHYMRGNTVLIFSAKTKTSLKLEDNVDRDNYTRNRNKLLRPFFCQGRIFLQPVFSQPEI